jgi:hypothetical protein
VFIRKNANGLCETRRRLYPLDSNPALSRRVTPTLDSLPATVVACRYSIRFSASKHKSQYRYGQPSSATSQSHRLPSLLSSTTSAHRPNCSDEVVVELTSCPDRDVFQIGRAIHSTNDWVLPGYIHLGDDGFYCGPLGRWACRIECERTPPYRCFVFAGGFNDNHVGGFYLIFIGDK